MRERLFSFLILFLLLPFSPLIASAQTVSTQTVPDQAIVQAVPDQAIVAPKIPAMTKSNLNVRNGAGMQFDIEGIIPAYTLIEVRDCTQTWCYITLDNTKTGWVSKAFLAFSATHMKNQKNISGNKTGANAQDNAMKPELGTPEMGTQDLGNYRQDSWYWSHKD